MAGWAVGSEGTILHWDADSWRVVSSPAPVYLFDVDMITPDDGLAVGEAATIFHWDGNAWAQVPSPYPPLVSFRSVDMLSANHGRAAGGGESMLKFTAILRYAAGMADR